MVPAGVAPSLLGPSSLTGARRPGPLLARVFRYLASAGGGWATDRSYCGRSHGDLTLKKPIVLRAVDVNAQLAQKWLDTNEGNRKVSQNRVISYAEAMTDGQWQENGETIKFDPEGNLIDGQHRLEAVVLADVTVRMDVAENVPPESLTTIDTGRARSVSDYLGMQGHSYAGTRSRVASMLVRMEKDAWTSVIRVTADQALGVLRKYPELEDEETDLFSQAHRIWLETRLNNTAALIAMIITRRLKPRLSEDFEEGVLSGANLEEHDPRLALRRFAHAEYLRKRHGGPRQQLRHYIAYLKAWNAFVLKRPIQILRVTDTETPPKLSGAPVAKR